MTPLVQLSVAWPLPPRYTLLCRFQSERLRFMLSWNRFLVALVAVGVVTGACNVS